MSRRNADTSSSSSRRPIHCSWFRTKTCTTPHPAATARPTAFGSPPAIDMWAPRLSGVAPSCALWPAGSAELLHLGEDLRRIGQLSSTVALHEPDDAVPIDHEHRTMARVELRPVDPVPLDYVPLDVGQQGIRDAAERLRPCLVTVDRVAGDAHDLGIHGLEVAEAGFEGRHLLASARGPVENVEEQHDRLPPLGRQAPLLAADPLQSDLGRRVSNLGHFRHTFLLCSCRDARLT